MIIMNMTKKEILDCMMRNTMGGRQNIVILINESSEKYLQLEDCFGCLTVTHGGEVRWRRFSVSSNLLIGWIRCTDDYIFFH